MYRANVTNDFDNMTNDYIDNKCTDKGNNIEIIIPLFTIIPCGMSLICLLYFMVYTLLKPSFNDK